MQTKVNLNHYEGKFNLKNRLKSKIQMDKRKLVNIIVKDLEELKILSEEVADSQVNSSLIIDLAVNKARLLIQEIELLREIAVNSVSFQKETDEDEDDSGFDDEGDEVSDISFPDPELEILHFEEGEFPATEEESEVDDDEDFDDEDFDEEDQEEVEPEIEENEELSEKEEPELEEEEQEDAEEELEEEDLTETEEEEELEEEEDDELEEEEEEEPLQKQNIQVTELSNSPQPGIREIHIDEFDDDDLEPIHFEPVQASSVKPPMREIPKPDNSAVGQNIRKERSLNDSMGETKQESKLSNSPITSLRAAIGLNDRFLFIREIFNNNSEKYNAVIEHLDKMEQIQEAVEYLKANLSMEKNETTMKFVDLLKRRFSK
ncbi:MAG: hypothetical protein Q8R96_15675 [Bacteroidota bacterium]|nr:hypothetical protein [Bacteroidota bacterium]